MQLSSIPPLIGTLVFGALGLFVLANRPRTPASIGYATFAAFTVWWQGTWAVLYNTGDPAVALLWARLCYSGIVFLPVAYFHFNAEFVEPGRHMRSLPWHYAIGFGFFLLLWTTRLFIDGCYDTPWGFYPKAGKLHWVYLSYLTYSGAFGVYLPLKHLRSGSERPLRATQLKYVLVANLIYLCSTVNFHANYGASYYPFGVVFCVVSSAIIAYAILRHQLLDIRPVFRVGVICSFLAIAVGTPLGLLAWKLTDPVAKALVGFLGPVVGGVLLGALKGPLARVVERLPVFRARYERLKRLEEVKRVIGEAETEEGWAVALGRSVEELMGPCEVSVMMYEKSAGAYIEKGGEESGRRISEGAAIVRVLEGNTILIRDLLDNMLAPGDVEVARVGMEMMGAEVSIPIRRAGGMVAVVSVGRKEGGVSLRDVDVTVLWGLARVGEEAYRELMAREEHVKKERLAAIGEMASVVSHEVKTPLAVIQNSAHFLKSRLGEGGDEKVVKHLGIIGVQAEALDRIVKGILDYARAKELSLKSGKVNEMVREVVETLPRAEGVEIELKLMKDLPEVVFDHGEMRQALTNVLNNAMEALPQGGKVEVATGVKEEGGVYLSVRDNGVGIAREHLSKIFEPFFTTRGGGTGLGLAVVKKVVEQHRGVVEVNSEPGKGTTVTMTLPVEGLVSRGSGISDLNGDEALPPKKRSRGS